MAEVVWMIDVVGQPIFGLLARAQALPVVEDVGIRALGVGGLSSFINT